MSIRNFPENPKIILRKSADQAKAEKNPYSELENHISLIFEVFDVLLRGATLNFRDFDSKYREFQISPKFPAWNTEKNSPKFGKYRERKNTIRNASAALAGASAPMPVLSVSDRVQIPKMRIWLR